MGPVVGRPYIRAITFHKNVFSKSTGPIRTNFGMRHPGSEGLQVVLPVCIHLPKEDWVTNKPKSGILFKFFLVRNCGAERTEINIEASGACLDVKLCSAWRLASRKRGRGGPPGPSHWLWTFLAMDTNALLPNYLSDSNQISYAVSG